MKIKRTSIIILLSISIISLLCGCISQEQYNDMKAQNRIQQQRLAEIEGELKKAQLELSQSQKQLETLQGQSTVSMGARDEEIAALEKDIEAKKALIEKMQTQLLRGGVVLPDELNLKLQDFARDNDMVTFDSATGILKFKSDLLFDLGSDKVASGAVDSIKTLCGIMNSEEGKEFDIVVAGHTDDVRIAKQATRAKHPTNWHLSVHRAISVLDLMTQNKVEPKRLSVRGFGEYRPLEPNKPNKGGNAANRRVEIYIVPKGA